MGWVPCILMRCLGMRVVRWVVLRRRQVTRRMTRTLMICLQGSFETVCVCVLLRTGRALGVQYYVLQLMYHIHTPYGMLRRLPYVVLLFCPAIAHACFSDDCDSCLRSCVWKGSTRYVLWPEKQG